MSEMPDARPSAANRFRYRLSPVDMKRGLWVVSGSLLVLVGLGFLGADHLGDTILEDLQEQPAWALGLALLGIVVLAVLLTRIVRQAGEAWLVVDSHGIRCSPHRHHGSRQWVRHDWQLPWTQVQRAVVRRPGRRNQNVQGWMFTSLTLETADVDYTTALLQWEPVGDPLDRPDLTALRPGKRLHRLTETHPLIAHIQQRGIEVDYQPLGFRGRWGIGKASDRPPTAGAGEGAVDLLSYPSLVAMLSLLVAVGGATALHYAALPPIRALFSPSWGVPILAGSAVFAIGAMLGSAAPPRERTIVALLLGLAVIVCWQPLSLRIQSMSGEAATSSEYIVDGPGLFAPVDSSLPPLDLRDLDIPEYWESLAPGSSYDFGLQRLGSDRYVLRMGQLYERTRAFYSNRQDAE